MGVSGNAMSLRVKVTRDIERLCACTAAITGILAEKRTLPKPNIWQRLSGLISVSVEVVTEENYRKHAFVSEALAEFEQIISDFPCESAPIVHNIVHFHLRFPCDHSLSAMERWKYIKSALSPLWRQCPSFALFCSLSGDGYIREAALRSVNAPAANPLLVHILLYRLLDWVPVVRVQAQACLRRVTAVTNPAIMAEGFLGALATLPRRQAWREAGPSLIEYFDGAGIFGLAVEQLALRQQGPSGLLLRRLMSSPQIDARLPVLATTARQPVVRAAALRCLLSGMVCYPVGLRREWVNKAMGVYKFVPDIVERLLTITPAPRCELILQAISDNAACVRRIALEAAMREPILIIPVDQLRRLALADKSASVRSRASWLLRQPLYGSVA